MQNQEREDIETYLAEDLLVTLGAVRMALSWVSPESATNSLQRVDEELAELQDRTKSLFRSIRAHDPMIYSIQPSAGLLNGDPTSNEHGARTSGELDPINLDAPPMDAATAVLTNDRISALRPRESAGLAPSWTTDIDEFPESVAPLAQIKAKPRDEPGGPLQPENTQLDPDGPTEAPLSNGGQIAPDMNSASNALVETANRTYASDDLGDSIEALLSSALSTREEIVRQRNGSMP